MSSSTTRSRTFPCRIFRTRGRIRRRPASGPNLPPPPTLPPELIALIAKELVEDPELPAPPTMLEFALMCKKLTRRCFPFFFGSSGSP